MATDTPTPAAAAATSAAAKSAGPRRRHTFARGGDQRQFDHEVLEVNRVVRVVKGGRRFRFRAAVIVGDHNGRVGLGIGKSRDVQQAIQKATDQGAKNVIQVNRYNDTIPHTIAAKFNGARVYLKPARPGTGIIAGGVVRTVADLAGIKNLVSKAMGSSNRVNNARAALLALSGTQARKEKAQKNPSPK